MEVPIIGSLVYFCVGMFILVGAVGGLNQTKVQKLYAFSGITHIGIMLWGLVIGWSGVGHTHTHKAKSLAAVKRSCLPMKQ